MFKTSSADDVLMPEGDEIHDGSAVTTGLRFVIWPRGSAAGEGGEAELVAVVEGVDLGAEGESKDAGRFHISELGFRPLE